MPRITNQQYINIHRTLRQLWEDDFRHFEKLSGNDQLTLHQYFAPSKELSDDELLAHRQAVTLEEPSLPNQAGKTWARLQRIIAGQEAAYTYAPARHQPSRVPAGSRGKRHNIIVTSVLRPEPDVRKIAEALIKIALADAEAEIEARRQAAADQDQLEVDTDAA